MVRRVRSTLKSSRKGEVLRAIKRLQAARGGGGGGGDAASSNKSREKSAASKESKDGDVLAKELEATKHAPLDLLAHRVVGRKLIRSRLLPKAKLLRAGDAKEFPLLATALAGPGGGVYASVLAATRGDLEERVYERFTSAKAVAAAASAGVNKLENLLGHNKPAAASRPGRTSKDQERSASTSQPGAAAQPVRAAGSEDDQDGAQDGTSSVEAQVPEFGKEWDALVGSGSEGEEDEDDGPLPESDFSDVEVDGSRGGSCYGTDTGIDTDTSQGQDQGQGQGQGQGPIVAGAAARGSGDKGVRGGLATSRYPASESEDEPAGDTSPDSASDSDSDSSEGGLPSLAAGYVDRGVRLSGKGDASDYSDEEADATAPVRRNRMGQRARRALWEKKFGRGAKHVQANAEAKTSRRDSQRVSRGRGKGRPVPPPHVGTSSNDTPLGSRAKPLGTHMPKPKPGKPTDDKPVHPSWVAKQQQKKQAEAKPQGKKLVFD